MTNNEKTEFDLLLKAAYVALTEIEKQERASKPITDDVKKPIRELGEFLHKVGGIEEMRCVLQMKFKPYDRRLIEIYWDGIGAWLG